jgi:toxin-antitoxin system PIN domain toxin
LSATVDIDVLVFASHQNSPFHDRASRLLTSLSAGPTLVYLFWPVALGYLRIVTHPSLLESPLTPAEATANIDSLVQLAHVRAAGEVEGFWPTYRRVADDVRPRGNLVPDAHLVALMLQHGVSTIWTHDRDLRKFAGIRVEDPFAI